MSDVRDGETIRQVWEAAVREHGDKPFVVVPRNPSRDYDPGGIELTYAETDARVRRMMEIYRAAGYGVGHRVALLLENRPTFFVARLALNAIGVSCVPVNPDYRSSEIAYLIGHSKPELVLTIATRRQSVLDGIAESAHKPPVVVLGDDEQAPPVPRTRAASADPTPLTESSILYTSGTTGQPKGCRLSHGYEVALGDWYLTRGGLAEFRPGQERIYNPLPLYHVNAGIVSFFGAILSGNAQVQPDRFHPERWWREVVETRATVVHYLGVVIQMLMLQEDASAASGHHVRFGVGAGVEPQLHAAFEARFGFPLLELWGMTETCRVLMDGTEPRKVGTRAMGRAVPGLDVRVVDEADVEVADGTPGEMVVRHSAATPRRGAFLGYLDNDAETERAWRGGWFHTGDTVYRAPDGMLHFVDRKKNIIRRSGENIAAAEIEALLLTHPDVAQAAVMAVKDEIREEEVLACIVLKAGAGTGDRAKAEDIFAFCNARLAYYKPPGWIWFARELPTTGTQKIQKHTIFPTASDPRAVAGMIDLRALKRRR
ncbi:MAG: AMP-binding protein [Hyphomicrobiaceae bacterium]